MRRLHDKPPSRCLSSCWGNRPSCRLTERSGHARSAIETPVTIIRVRLVGLVPDMSVLRALRWQLLAAAALAGIAGGAPIASAVQSASTCGTPQAPVFTVSAFSAHATFAPLLVATDVGRTVDAVCGSYAEAFESLHLLRSGLGSTHSQIWAYYPLSGPRGLCVMLWKRAGGCATAPAMRVETAHAVMVTSPGGPGYDRPAKDVYPIVVGVVGSDVTAVRVSVGTASVSLPISHSAFCAQITGEGHPFIDMHFSQAGKSYVVQLPQFIPVKARPGFRVQTPAAQPC